jgi:hypothetical protein
MANDRLRQVLEAKDTEMLVLREQLEVLRAEVAELRARLGASSRNSSKPPSADGLGRPVSRSLRGRSGRKPGRPKGQPGAPLAGVERRQVKDLAGAALAVDGTLNGISPGRMATARHEFRSAILIGQTQTAARAGPLMRKHHALARRLRDREDDYLRFTTDPRAPFDNNAAEREIRMGKLRIKVSGCMRSMADAENFCAIRSYLSTAKKHGIGILDALTQAATGTAWIPAVA